MMMLPWLHHMDGRIMTIASCFGFAMPLLSAASKLKVCKFRRGQIIPRSFLERVTFICVTVLLLLAAPVWGQAPLQLLHGHLRPEVSSGRAALVGPLSPTEQIDLSIMLPLRNEATLNTLLSRFYDPASPKYRQFLNVAQFTEQFSPTAEDYQTVVTFAEANGFKITGAPRNRLIVPIQGTIEQVEKAFHVNMNVYRDPNNNDRTFFSLDKEPSVDLQVPLWHIAGLDNYSIPHPLYTQTTPKQAAQSNTTGSGLGGSFLGSDRRAAYYGGSSLTGSGQAVGLFELDGYNMSDVNAYFANVQQTLNVPITPVLLLGASSGSDGNDTEQVIDIIDAVSMAPGLSKVLVYIAPGGSSFSSGTSDVAIFNQMASDNIAKQISVSWGWMPADPKSDEPIFKELESQGQNIFVATGDHGAWNSNDFVFPAEDPYVVAVGGTDLTTNGAGGSWSSETAWLDSGGGVSPDGLPIPSYQQSSGVITSCNGGSTTSRNAPDVSAEANGDNYFCANGSCGTTLGGTSLAAPTWAGFMALVNQQAVNAGRAPVGGLGFINPTVYSIGEGSNYLNDLHDITSGSNGAYSACPGYDLVTGWGSPAGQNLINDMVGSAPLPTATPSESNVIVTLNGMPPTSINYAITFQDATPGATIYYQVTICNTPYGWATTTSGSTVNFYNSCPSTTPYGTMYATAPGYLQSASTSMSF